MTETVNKEPHWVQIEMKPNGDITGFSQIDLADFHSVFGTRQNRVLIKLHVIMKNGVQHSIDNEKGAQSLMAQWEKYNGHNFKHRDEEAAPSDIVIARNAMPSMGMNSGVQQRKG